MPTEIAQNSYELMVILSGDLTESDFAKEFDAIKKMVKENGTVTHEEKWGVRRFPFKIKKLMRGHYGILNFSAEPHALVEIRDALRLNTLVVRSLILVMPVDYKPGTHTDVVIPLPVKDEEESQERGHRKVDVIEKKPRPVESIKHEGPTSEEVPVKHKEVVPTLSKEEQEEQLKKVSAKLDDILDDPDLKL